jgi:hypothetical protein
VAFFQSPARVGAVAVSLMRTPESQDGCRLKSKQGSDYAGGPRPASARFRRAICPAW